MINFMYMVQNFIEETFTRQVGKWQGEIGSDGEPTKRKALLIHFRMKKKKIQMLIHAPANYVGVYIREGKKEWECISYHDSCWRHDGVKHFLWEHRDDDIQFCFFPITEGFDIHETIVRGVHVVKLDEVQLDGLKQVRKKKYT